MSEEEELDSRYVEGEEEYEEVELGRGIADKLAYLHAGCVDLKLHPAQRELAEELLVETALGIARYYKFQHFAEDEIKEFEFWYEKFLDINELRNFLRDPRTNRFDFDKYDSRTHIPNDKRLRLTMAQIVGYEPYASFDEYDRLNKEDYKLIVARANTERNKIMINLRAIIDMLLKFVPSWKTSLYPHLNKLENPKAEEEEIF